MDRSCVIGGQGRAILVETALSKCRYQNHPPGCRKITRRRALRFGVHSAASRDLCALNHPGSYLRGQPRYAVGGDAPPLGKLVAVLQAPARGAAQGGDMGDLRLT